MLAWLCDGHDAGCFWLVGGRGLRSRPRRNRSGDEPEMSPEDLDWRLWSRLFPTRWTGGPFGVLTLTRVRLPRKGSALAGRSRAQRRPGRFERPPKEPHPLRIISPFAHQRPSPCPPPLFPPLLLPALSSSDRCFFDSGSQGNRRLETRFGVPSSTTSPFRPPRLLLPDGPSRFDVRVSEPAGYDTRFRSQSARTTQDQQSKQA